MHCRPFVDGQEDREGVARLWEIKEDWAQFATKMRTYGPSSSYPALVLAEHDGQIFGAIEGCMDADLSENWQLSTEHQASSGIISMLMVDPGCRRQRVGHRLVAAFAQLAADHGCSYLGLHPDESDLEDRIIGRRAFFVAVGFEPDPLRDDLYGSPVSQLLAISSKLRSFSGDGTKWGL